MDALFTLIVLAVGFFAGWKIFSWHSSQAQNTNKDVVRESQILLERIEKVFKVVMAEGYFTEIYDHNTKKAFLKIFKTNSKALVIAKAKVSVGYDFSKIRFKRDFANQTLVIEHFSEPEVLATDTDYKFYDINQGLLNKFDNDDYTEILAEAKKLMLEKAYESELPQIAQQQIHLMMQQLCASIGWKLHVEKILEPIKTASIKLD